ncbi:uncharacterized protein LOC120848191 [Ixodes scapularis]|uniref:uncharacterized protein LOC120848191 n=1 Tax=Ixodes scapularis TaxID=6945 RepID=UPI001A9DEEC0|nr:uncharacterized protein LOC120848191 [Ixodes scapularis]
MALPCGTPDMFQPRSPGSRMTPDFYQGGIMLMSSGCGSMYYQPSRGPREGGRMTCPAGPAVGQGSLSAMCFKPATGGTGVPSSDINIARYVTIRLNQLKWNVLWEPHYNVQGKVMKPGLVVTRGAMAVIIDVQVVGTDMELAFLHEQKADRYTVPDLLQQVQGNRQEPPLVTTVTMNFRDIWSKDSARDLLLLGLTKSDLKLMTVRCLQGGPPMLLGTLQNDDCD